MTKMYALRLPEDLIRRLRKASQELYAPTQAEIVRRGIELALAEYEQTRKGTGKGKR